MNEQFWSEQFGSEVDALLNEARRVSPETAPAEYVEALEVAHTLAGLDFSRESRQRETLRRRLLGEAQHAAFRKERTMTTVNWRRISLATVAGSIMVLAVTLSLFYPGGIAAAAQRVIEIIQSITLGDYSRAIQVEPGAQDDQQPVPSDMWIIRTEIGNFGGNAPPGVAPAVRTVATVKEAQAIANFSLFTPTDLPDGYALREVKLAPIGWTHWVLQFYSGPAHDIIIVQMPSGPQLSDDPNVVSGIFTGFVTDGILEQTEFDGRPAVWVDGHTLAWAEGNMTHEVGGLDLTLDAARQIARSLR